MMLMFVVTDHNYNEDEVIRSSKMNIIIYFNN